MKVLKIKTAWPENGDFVLEREKVEDECIFIHMTTRAQLSEKGQLRACPAGSCILYPPGSHQLLKAFSEGLIHDWMHLSPDAEREFRQYGLMPDTLYLPAEDRVISSLMGELELETMNPRAFSAEFCDGKLRELMIRLFRGLQNDTAENFSPERHDTFSELRADIHRDYARDWSVEEMAALAHVSPSRFFALYKGIFGVSPKEDLLMSRLEHAKMFLSESDRPVKTVAEMTGYGNVYHFIRAFKKYTGKTPGEYRNEEKDRRKASR